MAASSSCLALVIHGLRNPSDAEDATPIVFASRDLPAAALPSPLSGYTVIPWLESISGWNYSSDPRRVIGSGGVVSVLLKDPDAVLGTQLLRNASTGSWDIESTRIEPGATSIKVTGTPGALPTVDQVYWIEQEAVKVTAVSARSLGGGSSTASATLTVTRAACGSWDVLHRLDPLAYDPRSDGAEDRLQLDSRPGLGAYTFLCSLYRIRLNQYGGLKSYVRRWGYLQAVPTPKKGRRWELKVADLGELLAAHQLGDEARQVTLSRAVQVLAPSKEGGATAEPAQRFHGLGQALFELGQNIADGQPPPPPETPPPPVAKTAALWLERHEAERFFREPLHRAGLAGLDETMVDNLAAEIITSKQGGVDWYVELEAAGKWVYQLTAVSYQTATSISGFSLGAFVRVDLTHVKGEPGAGFDYAQGWSPRQAGPVGSSPPKAALRLKLKKTPMQAWLTLAISDGAATASAYDIIPGRVGLGLPPEVLNVSTSAGDPLQVSISTKKIAERDQLLGKKFAYFLQLGKAVKLGDFLRGDVFLLHGLLPGPLLAGPWTARPWIYPAPASPHDLTSTARFVPEAGQRLPLLRALRLSSGFNLLSLEPEYVRDIKLAQVRERGVEAPLSVRCWLPGNQIGLDALTGTGQLAPLVTAWLQTYGGEPVVYEVETSLDEVEDAGLEFLDFVTWSDPEVLSSAGKGVSGNFVIFGLAFNWQTGIARLRLIPDTFTVSQTTRYEAQIAPTLKVKTVTPVAGLQVDLEVESLGDATFDASADHGGIWQELADLGIQIHVTRPAEHNATGALEREGWLESYATIDSITVGAGTSTLRVTFDAAWERDGFVLADLAAVGDTFISLPDRRDADANPQGDLIEPPDLQRYDGGSGEAYAMILRPGALWRELVKMGA